MRFVSFPWEIQPVKPTCAAAGATDLQCCEAFSGRNAACNLAPSVYFSPDWCGVVAQLVERLVRNEKVAGSIPVGSTIQFIGHVLHYLENKVFAGFLEVSH